MVDGIMTWRLGNLVLVLREYRGAGAPVLTACIRPPDLADVERAVDDAARRIEETLARKGKRAGP